MRTIVFTTGAVLLVAVSFVGGMYYLAAGGPVPAFLGLAVVAPNAMPDVAAGTVRSVSGQTLILQRYDGGTQAYSIDPAAQVLALYPVEVRTLQDVRPGSNVSIVLKNGAASVIQLFATSTALRSR